MKTNKCKKCKNKVQEGFLFCPYCGTQLIKNKTDETQVKVPAPHKTAAGLYYNRIMVHGETYYVSEETEKEYYVKARAIKTGAIQVEKKPYIVTLKAAEEAYVQKRSNTCSPSTIQGYNKIIRTRFKAYADRDIHSIDWQQMIDDEAKVASAKTIANSLYFVASCVGEYGIHPKATLPQVIRKPARWLKTDDVKAFIDASAELPVNLRIGVLLALHGLRKSEVYAVTPNDVRDGYIHVEGAYVPSDKGYVLKETNKNQSSRRAVPIMIPVVNELLKFSDCPADVPYMSGYGANRLWKASNAVCKKAGLNAVGVHGLRKTMASAASKANVSEEELKRLGGWSSSQALHSIYIQVSEDQLSEAARKIQEQFNPDEKK